MFDFVPRDWIVEKGQQLKKSKSLRQAKMNTCISSSHSYIIHQSFYGLNGKQIKIDLFILFFASAIVHPSHLSL